MRISEINALTTLMHGNSVDVDLCTTPLPNYQMALWCRVADNCKEIYDSPGLEYDQFNQLIVLF